MKSKISALMDSELDARELHEPLCALGEDGDARESWRTYHLISDALHGGALLSANCAPRVAQRLAREPALIAPLPSAIRPPERARWFVPSALAASVAAVALVGWVALAPQQGPAPAPAPLAQAPQAERTKEPAQLTLTSAAQDYLIAHQAFSPRNSLQGMAPYVRSVADQAPARKP
jgi:sigma-E factor negative regulatory protein RseA